MMIILSDVITYTSSGSADDDKEAVTIKVNDTVNITFAIKYMNHFAKATSLSDQVKLSMSNDHPIGNMLLISLI